MPTNDTYRGERENRAMLFRLYLLKSGAHAWGESASFAVDVLENTVKEVNEAAHGVGDQRILVRREDRQGVESASLLQ